MKLRIRERYALIITTLIVSVIVVLATLMLIEYRNSYHTLKDRNTLLLSQQLTEQLEKRGVIITRLLAENLVKPLRSHNVERMFQLASAARRQQDVIYVVVFDHNNKIVQNGLSSSELIGKDMSSLNFSESFYTSGQLEKDMSKEELRLMMPLYNGGDKIGGVVVGFSLQGIFDLINKISADMGEVSQSGLKSSVKIILFSALIMILLGMFWTLLVTNKLTKPIINLVETVRSVGKGEYKLLPVDSRDDEISQLVEAFNDLVNDLQTTMVSHDYMDKVINTMTDCMFVVDNQGTIELANDGLCRLLSYEKSFLLGKHYSLLFEDSVMPELNMLRATLLKHGQVANFDVSIYARYGAEIPVSLSAAMMVSDGTGQRKFIYMAQDITERIQFQQKLQKAKEKAESANRAKSAFIANMSHEIRTPLTAIIGFSETLLDAEQTLPERERSVKTIIRSARHLLQIINDILDISKVEVDKLEVECLDVDLFALIAELRMLSGLLAEENGLYFRIHYQLPLPRMIVSDPVRLKQILLNLCSNAIKFTSKGGIDIFIRADIHNMMLYFEVVDTGIGMSKEQIQKIFGAFQQADSSTTRKYGGTGLGLYLSGQLAELLGGSLKVDSVEGKGSKFTLAVDIGELDLSNIINNVKDIPQEDDQIAPQIMAPVGFAGQRILLAEDNIDNQRLISMYLKRMGFQVDLVENGLEAVEKAAQNRYDLVLMDMQMPIMNGLDATQTLRDMGYKQPIVALTANAMKADVEKFYAAGCDNFIAKPIDRQKFFTVISTYFDAQSDAASGNEASAETKLTAHTQVNSDMKLRSSLLDEDPEMIDLVRAFVSRLPGIVDEIIELYQKGDHQQLQAKIHDLKSVGGNYGYQSISDVAREIDIQLGAGKFEGLEAHIAQLTQLCQAVLAGARDLTA